MRASAPHSLANAVAMTHVVYTARFVSSREPYQRLYVGMTDNPAKRPAQLENRSLGKQTKFCRPMQGAPQFDIVCRVLSKATAKVLEAQVAAHLYARHKAVCVRGAGWSLLTLRERHEKVKPLACVNQPRRRSTN